MKKERIVIKVGSSSLMHDKGINQRFILHIANEIQKLKSANFDVILVTSGAVAAAKVSLPDEMISSLSGKQALSAIGQAKLIHMYDEIFALFEMTTAQVLLTNDDFKSKKRMLNFRNTLEQLFELDAVPIINENDALSSAEIQFGDNDTLGSLVAVATEACRYVILSDIEGLYTTNPMHHADACLIPIVEVIDDTIRKMAGGSTSSVGTGGMKTKISAAEIATRAGVDVSIAKSDLVDLADKIIQNAPIGTTFLKRADVSVHNHWIGFHSTPNGKICIDEGAASALQKRKSLLAVGITEVIGDFHMGDTVEIYNSDTLIGRGITNFDSAEIRLIQGHANEQHKIILGVQSHTSVIHANNLVLK